MSKPTKHPVLWAFAGLTYLYALMFGLPVASYFAAVESMKRGSFSDGAMLAVLLLAWAMVEALVVGIALLLCADLAEMDRQRKARLTKEA